MANRLDDGITYKVQVSVADGMLGDEEYISVVMDAFASTGVSKEVRPVFDRATRRYELRYYVSGGTRDEILNYLNMNPNLEKRTARGKEPARSPFTFSCEPHLGVLRNI